MKKHNETLTNLENLTEEQKLQLFNVEELETRLEMAAVAKAPTGGGDDTCTKNSSCGW